MVHNLSLMILAGLVLALHACGPTHTPQRFVEAGNALDLSVTVPDDKATLSSGTAYYRITSVGQIDYQSERMRRRGNELYLTLATAELVPGDAVEYYFDIILDDELHQMASPTAPYLTTFATLEDVIAHSLSTHVSAGDASEDVTFTLNTGRVIVDHAEVSYYAPNLPGRLVVPMTPWGDSFKHTIEADHVRPGYYRYRIHAYVGDTIYDLPLQGEASIRVTKVQD